MPPISTKQQKRPSFQFYPGDWLKDPKLSQCEPSTRGIWIDLICAMWENGQNGNITGTVRRLARICRCDTYQMEEALREIRELDIGNIDFETPTYRIKNRRMARDAVARGYEREKKRKQRSRDETEFDFDEVNAQNTDEARESTTPQTGSQSGDGGSDLPAIQSGTMSGGAATTDDRNQSTPAVTTETRSPGKATSPESRYPEKFCKFWSALPSANKKGKGDALRAWSRALKKGWTEEDILGGVSKFLTYERWRREHNPDYIPLFPASWIRAERWTDEVQEPERRGVFEIPPQEKVPTMPPDFPAWLPTQLHPSVKPPSPSRCRDIWNSEREWRNRYQQDHSKTNTTPNGQPLAAGQDPQSKQGGSPK